MGGDTPFELAGSRGNGLMVVVKDFKASNQNEMDVCIGDEVFLQGGNSGKGDGWAVGINARSGATGLCPLECLETKDKACEVVVPSSSGGYNNMYRRSSNGGWAGGRSEKVSVPVKKINGADQHNRVERRASNAHSQNGEREPPVPPQIEVSLSSVMVPLKPQRASYQS